MRIELVGVDKRFGRVHALREISCAIPAGSRVALVGPNGSGKSTLTRILMGMLVADGSTRVGGFDPFRERRQLAQRLAYVPQEAPALPVPVGELVQAIGRVRGTEVGRIAEIADVLDLDYRSLRRRTFRTLSGGMKQKLLIALALATNPELLLLDEPTAALDTAARASFFRYLDALSRETTVVLSSHRLEELQHLVDRVVVLADGRLVEEGPIAEFLARRSRCRIELRTSDAAQARRLEEKGFRASAAGWWTIEIARGEKEELLRWLVARWTGDLGDLAVRDVDGVGGEADSGGVHVRAA